MKCYGGENGLMLWCGDVGGDAIEWGFWWDAAVWGSRWDAMVGISV